MKLIVIYVIGLIFGLGISISGMANPAKVLNFFDVAGTWDPSLAFVMGGAVVVAGLGYRLVFRRPRAGLRARFQRADQPRHRRQAGGGSAVFGIGWGIAGFCPGAALPVAGHRPDRRADLLRRFGGGPLIARYLMRLNLQTGRTGPGTSN